MEEVELAVAFVVAVLVVGDRRENGATRDVGVPDVLGRHLRGDISFAGARIF